MRKLSKRVAVFAFAAAASLMLFPPGAYATTTNFLYQIDDLGDQPSFSEFINGFLNGTLPISAEGFRLSTNFANSGLSFSADFNSAYNIFDTGGVTLSDLFSSSGTQGSSTLTLTFISDVEGGSALIPLTNALSLTETGDWQTVLSVSLQDATGTVAGNLTVQFRSDVTETPLPGALWLFGSALTGAAAFGRLRKKTAAL